MGHLRDWFDAWTLRKHIPQQKRPKTLLEKRTMADKGPRHVNRIPRAHPSQLFMKCSTIARVPPSRHYPNPNPSLQLPQEQHPARQRSRDIQHDCSRTSKRSYFSATIGYIQISSKHIIRPPPSKPVSHSPLPPLRLHQTTHRRARRAPPPLRSTSHNGLISSSRTRTIQRAPR